MWERRSDRLINERDGWWQSLAPIEQNPSLVRDTSTPDAFPGYTDRVAPP
jgi:hypothetical protein